MSIINVSAEQWKAINILLKDKPEGTKLKHRYSRYVHRIGRVKQPQEYQYQDEDGQTKKITFDHSFIVAGGQIWALPNHQEKAKAFIGKGQYGKVVIRENEQQEQSLHKIEYKSSKRKSNEEIQRSKREQQIAFDVGLAYTTVSKQYVGEVGKGKGDSIMVMPYENNPKDLKKKYQKQNIPITTSIKAFEQLQKLHRGELSKTGTKYLHRDLKLANITEDDNGKVALIDYGFAVSQDNVDKEYCGSPLMMAPEVLQTDGPDYSASTDLYALVKSLLLHEIELKFPYEDAKIKNIRPDLATIFRLPHINKEICQFLQAQHTVYQSNPSFYLSNQVLLDVIIKPKDERPTAEQVIEALVQQQEKIAEIERQRQIQIEQQEKSLKEQRQVMEKLKFLQDMIHKKPTLLHPGRIYLQNRLLRNPGMGPMLMMQMGLTKTLANLPQEVTHDEASLTDSENVSFHSLEASKELELQDKTEQLETVDQFSKGALLEEEKVESDVVKNEIAECTQLELRDSQPNDILEKDHQTTRVLGNTSIPNLIDNSFFFIEGVKSKSEVRNDLNIQLVEKVLNTTQNKAKGYVGYGGKTVNFNGTSYYYVPSHVAEVVDKLTAENFKESIDDFIQIFADELNKAKDTSVGWTSYFMGGRDPDIEALYSKPHQVLNGFKKEISVNESTLCV
ncbi:protein kinase [Thiotrichales bacterium 19X7-9]|nr:protein kinase [Thiotrichales bacterium 19X7-9]